MTPFMKAMPTASRNPALPHAVRPALLLAASMAVIACVLWVETRAPVRDDVAWLLYVAENWLDGGQPYGGLIEINPPTVIWLSMLPVLLARVLGASPLTVAPFFFAAVVLACALLTTGILRRRGVPGNSVATFSALATVLMLVPLSDFGQREHLIAAAALPFLALHAGSPSVPVRRADALLAGLLVAFCCGMKPHYLLPFALAGLAAARSGGRLSLLAAGAAAGGIAVLGAATLLLTPDYLRRVVPLALKLYVSVPSTPMLSPSLAPGLAAFIGCSVLWWRRRRLLEDGGTTSLLLAFALGSWAVYLLQDKGWFYHRLPALVATTLALLTWLAAVRRRPVLWRQVRSSMVAALLFAGVAQAGWRGVGRVALAADPGSRPEVRMAEILRSRNASSYVAFTHYLSWGFPLVQAEKVAWASHFASVWALWQEHEISLREPGPPVPGAPVRRQVVKDFLDGCPEVVAVAEDEGTDYLAVLAGEGPAFTAAWAHYRPVARIDHVQVYARPQGPQAALICGPRTVSALP